jgi:hypothetical protein
MTIDEAIEVLSALSRGRYAGEVKTAREAEKLGIEALKEVSRSRRLGPSRNGWRLPGETEE